MKFFVYLNDLDSERSHALSSGSQELLGIIEADSEEVAAEILGLELHLVEIDEAPAQYIHRLIPEVEFELAEVPDFDPDLTGEEKFVGQAQEAMRNRNEVYSIPVQAN